jgi:hypothetical protein
MLSFRLAPAGADRGRARRLPGAHQAAILDLFARPRQRSDPAAELADEQKK